MRYLLAAILILSLVGCDQVKEVFEGGDPLSDADFFADANLRQIPGTLQVSIEDHSKPCADIAFVRWRWQLAGIPVPASNFELQPCQTDAVELDAPGQYIAVQEVVRRGEVDPATSKRHFFEVQ